MKYVMMFFLFCLSLNASVYYSKVEPFQTYTIKAAASGKVLYADENAEGKISKGKVLVQLDDVLAKQELKSSYEKLKSMKSMMEITKKSIENAKIIAKIREENYNKIKFLKTKSRVDKDNELITAVNAKDVVLNLENTLESLNTQVNDQIYKIETLKDQIQKKKIIVQKDFLIYKLYVRNNDYVNVGTQIVDAYDVSKGKLTVFVSKDDYNSAKNGVIYINDKKTSYKIDKLWKASDSENISSYKAEILINAPKLFSKLVKIEFKAK
ncbi:MAG: hypothetical protein R3331_10400 [Sulfurospirillaceae bacterium]|nr:hypothetical protein [Sulfurospirillaceae bacterium]